MLYVKKWVPMMLAAFFLAACGGEFEDGSGSDTDDTDDTTDTSTDTGDDSTDQDTDSNVDQNSNLVLGTGTGSGFTAGEMTVSSANLSAGGSATVNVNLVDSEDSNALYSGESVDVTFSSTCEADGEADFSSKTVSTTTGQVETVYTSLNCVGTDAIVAKTDASTATVNVTVAPRDVGRIGFSGVQSSSIAYDEFWMSDLPSQTKVSFVLYDGFGNVVKGETVNFTIRSAIDGEGKPVLTEATAISDADGIATTYLQAGTLAVSVRVLASVTADDGSTITNISHPIAVNTGPTHFEGFNIRADLFAPEVYKTSTSGSWVDEVNITVYANDKNQNPVADGTVVSFWAEYGQIPASCEISNGSCSVVWNSSGNLFTKSGPQQLDPDGETTIMAWTAGEDTFLDADNTGMNGLYDDGDTLLSAPERFYDRNYNGTWDDDVEEYIDYDGNDVWTGGANASTKFRGYACSEAAAGPGQGHCATDVEVWDQLKLNMATSLLTVTALESANVNDPLVPAEIAGSSTFYVAIKDDFGNQAPAGTSVKVTAENGETKLIPDMDIRDGTRSQADIYEIQYTEDPKGEPSKPIYIDVTTPNGYVHTISVTAQIDTIEVIPTVDTQNGDGTFDVSLSMKSGTAVPDGTELTLETTNDTVTFAGGAETVYVLQGNTTFTVQFAADGLDAARGYVTFTATTPGEKEATALVEVVD